MGLKEVHFVFPVIVLLLFCDEFLYFQVQNTIFLIPLYCVNFFS